MVMRRLLIAVMISIAGLAGCAEVEKAVDPLNVLGITRPPVRVGITTLEFSPPPLMLPKRSLFRQDLAFHLDEPVVFELLTPRQVGVHLGSGRLSFAMLSAADFAEVSRHETADILAVPVNELDRTYRQGLIITAAKSSIEDLADAKGKRFHRLPANHPLNDAALATLLEAGVVETDLDRGILGLQLTGTHINSFEVAKSVVVEGEAIGVIEEADYEKWPEEGGNFVLMSPSRNHIRVIARTIRVPEGPVVVAKQVDPELREQVSEYLLNVINDKKLVLAPLGCKRFAEPIDIEQYEPYFEQYYKLRPPEPLPEMVPIEEIDPLKAPPTSETISPDEAPAADEPMDLQ
jgi:hypothetical protein